ncbi:thioredoxin family protein [Heyndrickxia shackletonii]|nr:thioredoxin family protein [Heyndrickxia shackletonii]
MIINANGQEIMKEIETNTPVLVDCWAPWCPACKMLAPILDEIHEEFGLKMIKVNADKNEDFISKFQVLGLPTLLLFQENQLVERIIGYQSKETLIDILKSQGMIV